LPKHSKNAFRNVTALEPPRLRFTLAEKSVILM
jgi:hypothetical protein